MSSSSEGSGNGGSSAASEDHWSHVRHDFRTPINQIIGYGEMLEEDAAAAGQDEAVSDLRKIQQAARRMLELINVHLNPSAPGMNKPSQAAAASASAASGQGAASASAASASAASASAGAEPSAAVDPGYQQLTTDEHTPEVASVHAGHVLVVDDNSMNRDMLAKRLERRGLTAKTAVDGRDALDILAGEPFDLVLLDVMMPRLDGYETLQAMKKDDRLRHVPVIMISALDELESVIRCIEAGAEDYLPKPFNPTLLRARINACLEKKSLRDAEQKYLQEIQVTQNRLSRELHDASEYVRSIFPEPLESPVGVTWHYQSCSELGGDSFGYHWLDEQHLAIYVLDVCGHGVGASLLSASAINVIRTGSMPVQDLTDPGAVLSALNNMFPMEKQNNMYFTLWYGVYNRATRELKFAVAGHPAALLLSGEGEGKSERLGAPGMVIGAFEDIDYMTHSRQVPEAAQLYVFSDGCYEIIQPDGSMLDVDKLEKYLLTHRDKPDAPNDWFLQSVGTRGSVGLDDDFTMVRVQF
jgi:sigma-B regulation protein RsbU (phosphoserine phosphatase)